MQILLDMCTPCSRVLCKWSGELYAGTGTHHPIGNLQFSHPWPVYSTGIHLEMLSELDFSVGSGSRRESTGYTKSHCYIDKRAKPFQKSKHTH